MIRRFCDCCGTEMAKANTPSLGYTNDRMEAEIKRNGSMLKVELIASKDNVANGGDFCKYCILDAFAKLDDRPRSAG